MRREKISKYCAVMNHVNRAFLSVVKLTCSMCLSLSIPLHRAIDARQLSFPKDHGSHRDFETEWWYLSGNLKSDDAREWGYHFTIFRRAIVRLRCDKKTFRLPLDVYIAHLAITNITERRFKFVQTHFYPFFGFAGAREDCLKAWVRWWKIEEKQGPIQLRAPHRSFGIFLEMVPRKRPVLHGKNGLEAKGMVEGEASYHYSITSLETSGRLKWRGKTHLVKGMSWLDREFGTAMLDQNISGWDWFSLRLNNDVDIMLSVLRRVDGTTAETTFGTVVSPEGTTRTLKTDDFRIKHVDFWASRRTGAVYPVAWEISIPCLAAELSILPALKDHELLPPARLGLVYWEAPVSIMGTLGGKTVAGNGYVELSGYDRPVGGLF